MDAILDAKEGLSLCFSFFGEALSNQQLFDLVKRTYKHVLIGALWIYFVCVAIYFAIYFLFYAVHTTFITLPFFEMMFHEILPALGWQLLFLVPTAHLTYLRYFRPRVLAAFLFLGIEQHSPELAAKLRESSPISLWESVAASLWRIGKMAGKLALLSLSYLPWVGGPIQAILLALALLQRQHRPLVPLVVAFYAMMGVCGFLNHLSALTILTHSLRLFIASRGLMRELFEPFLGLQALTTHQKKSFISHNHAVVFGFSLPVYVLIYSFPLAGTIMVALIQFVAGQLVAVLLLKDTEGMYNPFCGVNRMPQQNRKTM